MISGQGPRRKEYLGNAVTASFPYDFHINDASELAVYWGSTGALATLKTEGTNSHYTVTGEGKAAGGNVIATVGNLPPMPVDGLANVFILGDTPRNQLLQLPAGQPFSTASVEAAFDKLTKLVQELRERVDRGILLRPTSLLDNLVMPDPGASQLFGWNSAGTAWGMFTGAEITASGIIWFTDTIVEAGYTATLTHNLGSATARLVSPISEGWNMGGCHVVTKTANAFNVEFDSAAPAGGGNLSWGVTL